MKFSKRNKGADLATFKKLYDAHYEAVRNYLFYKAGDAQQAEDLAQEVFMILWEKRSTIQKAKVKSYLFTIATNLFLNEVKHQKVVLKFHTQPTQTSSNQTPQYLMEEEEFKRRLEEAISNLPEKNREVFLMNRIDKLTYREIGARLGISVKAVEKRMHKALNELRPISERI